MAGMSAMEKMVANMLGLTPEKMHEMLNGFSTLATTLKDQLDRVEAGLETVIANQDAILARMEAIENVGRSNGASVRGRGRTAGNGGGGIAANGNGSE